MAWIIVDKPSRGVAPDGFMSSSGDGFDTHTRGDGFFAPDGTWTPVVMGWDTWVLVPNPSMGTPVRGARTSTTARGGATKIPVRGVWADTGDGWTIVFVPLTSCTGVPIR
jgi:hypothetical protein